MHLWFTFSRTDFLSQRKFDLLSLWCKTVSFLLFFCISRTKQIFLVCKVWLKASILDFSLRVPILCPLSVLHPRLQWSNLAWLITQKNLFGFPGNRIFRLLCLQSEALSRKQIASWCLMTINITHTQKLKQAKLSFQTQSGCIQAEQIVKKKTKISTLG